MPVKCVMIISVCCNNAGKVYDDELLFHYSMPSDMGTAAASFQQQPVKMIKLLRNIVKPPRTKKKHVI